MTEGDGSQIQRLCHPDQIALQEVQGATETGYALLRLRGVDGEDPAGAFRQHLDPPPGHRRTIVTECGWKLRPDLAPVRTYVSREAAEAAERLLATKLRQQGYTVFGPR